MIGKRAIAQQPRPFAAEKGNAPGKHPPFRHLLRSMIAAAVLLIIVLGIITGYLEKWLWMRQLDYAGIFWTLLSVQWAMFCSAFVFAFLYLWVNLRQAAGNSAAFREIGPASQTGIDFSPRLWSVAASPCSLRLVFMPNGTPTSAFVTADRSGCLIRSSGSMSGSISFICPSTSCCRAA
jgi:hypothetical protein